MDLPNNTVRRRLNSDSTQHMHLCSRKSVVDIFQPQFPAVQDMFLCRTYFSNAEKLLRLRRDVSTLENEFANYIRQSVEE